MNELFPARDGVLHCEDIPLETLAAKHGTPLYVYSRAGILGMLSAYQEAFKKWDPIVAYAVKANSSLGIITEIAAAGGGADIVSGGELQRALKAGVPPSRIVFAGVGKSVGEMEEALAAGILLFNVESIPELELLDAAAGRTGRVAPIAIRVNPDVDPRTHAYITTGKKESKFGLDIGAALEAYRRALTLKHVKLIGIHSHIGSQITKLQPIAQAIEKLARVVKDVRALGIELELIDIGGGLGIDYQGEKPPMPGEIARALAPYLDASGCRLIIEPGRSIVGPAGVLVTRVHYVKETPIRRYVIVDAAMNDLLRPSLYDAYHPIEPARRVAGRIETTCEIVGPVCETGDFLAKGRVLPLPRAGELLAIGCAGAYGMAMASNYNLRPRAAEVLVDGAHARLIRRRETHLDMIRCEMEALS